MSNEGNIHLRSIQKYMQLGITDLVLTRFSDWTSTCTVCDIFFNSTVTKLCRLDVSLYFNVFDSNVSLNPSVFKNGTSGYTRQKYSENNSKHILICNKKSYICK